MALVKLSVSGRLTEFDHVGQEFTALAVGAGWDVWIIFL